MRRVINVFRVPVCCVIHWEFLIIIAYYSIIKALDMLYNVFCEAHIAYTAVVIIDVDSCSG